MADAKVAQSATCRQCGTEFVHAFRPGPKRIHCSDRCRITSFTVIAKQRRHEEIGKRMCKHCGVATRRPRYCSSRCSIQARDRRLGVRSMEQVRADNAERMRKMCEVCGGAFFRSTYQMRDAGRCCSRECGFELIRRPAAAGQGLRDDIAMYRLWGARTKAREREHLRTEAVRLRHARARLVRSIIKYVLNPCRPCVGCGLSTGATHAGTNYCEQCRAASIKQQRRASKARRRATERGLEAERFDPLEILMRDGWRCHICGVSTPKRLRGTYNDRAPELDHIVPLAKGGQHTRINTACACRKCNGTKADNIVGQLRLVA